MSIDVDQAYYFSGLHGLVKCIDSQE
uniref:Uncharacterized protein n=1 Tax=Arundo donax TaxID=35708 RepID=A0A0A9BN84_ARUDO